MLIPNPAFSEIMQKNDKNVIGIVSDFFFAKIYLQEKLKYDCFTFLIMNIHNLRFLWNFINAKEYIFCQVLSQRYNLTP